MSLGDIAFRFLNYIKEYDIKDSHVTVTDINSHMLEVGKIRSKALNHDPNNIDWQEGKKEGSLHNFLYTKNLYFS